MSVDCDPLIAVPQLYIVAVNVLLGVLFGFFVVRAMKLEPSLDVAVTPDDVRAIVLHGTAPPSFNGT